MGAAVIPQWRQLEVVAADGDPLVLDLRDPYCAGILVGVPEPGERELAARLVPRDGVCLDVGASIGIWSRHLSRLAPEGTVFAFEASPRTVALLATNTAAAPNVIVVRKAMAETSGSVRFSGNRSSDLRHLVRSGGIEVMSTSLDEFVRETKLSRLDFVKIDVEGAELPVFRGGVNALRRFQPTILFECAAELTARFDYSKEDLFAFLQGLGYSLRRVCKDGTLTEDLHLHGSTTNNYLAAADATGAGSEDT